MSDEALGDDQLKQFSDELTAAGVAAVYNPWPGRESVTIDLLGEAFQVVIKVGPGDPRGYELFVAVDDGSGNGDVEEVAPCVYAPWVVPLVDAVVRHITMRGSMPATLYRENIPPGGLT
ncbi:hypothetical protein AB0C84_41940 [Actinomadura sp. NPDC048955]|uniref:hypothetical protein n=1 Tax=Actinomadura sp. NPDC048955 TaxID=3158228 RepID=UPI0034090668